MAQRIVVIGIGNEFRGDDIAGLLVVKKLKESSSLFGSNITFYEHNGEGTALLELWQSADIVFLVDAVYSQNQVGKLYKLDLKLENLPQEWVFSTHAINIREAIELGKILNQLPQKIIFYGIAANNFTLGASLSNSIYQTIEITVEQLLQELS